MVAGHGDEAGFSRPLQPPLDPAPSREEDTRSDVIRPHRRVPPRHLPLSGRTRGPSRHTAPPACMRPLAARRIHPPSLATRHSRTGPPLALRDFAGDGVERESEGGCLRGMREEDARACQVKRKRWD